MNLKIILSAGGTGGHVFPAIAIKEELQDNNFEPILITDLRGNRFLKAQELKFYIIDIKRPMKGLFGKILFLFQLVLATIKTLILFYRIKPKLIIGFGGYPTIPIICAGIICRVPYILHEPNSILGSVNKLFMPLALKITFAYPNFVTKYSKYIAKIIITNNLIRKNIQILPRYRKKKHNIYTILIIGGSQGAKVFAEIVPQAIIQIIDKIQIKNYKIKIFHQVPNTEIENVKTVYNEQNIEYEVAEFFFNIHEKYMQADLLISRAGASTISEVTHLKLPAILIPYPYSSLNHQYFNALAFQYNGLGKCLEQRDLSANNLAAEILKAFDEHFKISNKNYEGFTRNYSNIGNSIMLNTIKETIAHN